MLSAGNATGIFSPGRGSDDPLTVKEIPDDTYTVLTTDINKELRFTNVAGCEVTLPDMDIREGSNFLIRNAAAGTVSVIADGVVIEPAIIELAQDETAGFIYTGPNTWDAVLGGGGGSSNDFTGNIIF